VSADNVTVRGLTFDTTPAREGVSFGSASSNLTLESCIFNGDRGGADSIFWYGPNYSGAITVRNCLVKNYNHWMLMDGNTSSAVPTTKLGLCTLDKNRFLDNAGSIALRGMEADPSPLAEFTNNEFAYGTSQHNYFWSAIEANNFRRVTVTGNTATGTLYASNERGFAQMWARSGNWTLTMSKNQVTGFDFLAQIACSATFYCPDSEDDRFVMSSETGAVTNVAVGATFTYPWSGGTYNPVNVARFPFRPTTAWADGLTDT
jgi:hypothetical protein